MKFEEIYDVRELFKPINKKPRRNHELRTKSNSIGFIFSLPREIIPKEQQTNNNNQEESPKKHSFTDDYRELLRKTIFTQTKQMLRSNKIIESLPNKHQQERVYKSKSPEIQRQHKLEPKRKKLFFQTNMKEMIEFRQIKPLVNKLPIISRLAKSKAKRNFQRTIFGYNTITTRFQGPSTSTIQLITPIPKPQQQQKHQKIYHQKSYLQPWDTNEESSVY